MTTPTRVEPDSAASPFRFATFRWFYAGRLVSLLGTSMAPIALAFAVLAVAKSSADLSIVLASNSIPLILFLIVGGAVADRFPRQTVLRVSNLGAAVTQATAATVILTGSYQVWILALIEVANGTLAAFSTPATRGIVPQLVPTAQLPKANALLATARSAATIIGPSIAGLVVATTSGGWALAFDAATYAFAFGCLGHLRITGRPAQQSGILREIRDGWTSFRSLQWVWVVVISVGLTNFARSGVWGVLGPTIAKHSIGAPAWGLVVSTRAIGLLVMGLVMYRVVFRRFLFVGQCALVFGSLPLILLGVSPNTGALCCGAFLAGAGSGVFGPAWETSLQEHVPPGMLSRISSYDDLLSFAPVPVGQLLVGPLALAVGAEPVAATGGAVFLLAAIMPVFVRSVRQLPHRTAAETE